ncbi:MAG: Hsp70 family protein [Deltaproteobacteria bacterium]|nr:Hsp70 family protein [Deltaproteobacteria bacterium]
MRLGIDFGTTRTVVAVCDRGNYPVVGFVGPGGESLDWYPTVVAERDGALRYGLEALGLMADPSWTVVRSFKRFLSSPAVQPDGIVRIGGTDLTLLDLLTGFFEALQRDIREDSNLPEPRRASIDFEAFVATPANAHSTQRFLTLEAFRRAGFEVAAMMNEPSAAGVEYAHRYRNTITKGRENIVVYDLGGGTFDVSLVRMTGQNHDVAESSGIARLGGDDFDSVLLDLALAERGISRRTLTSRTLEVLSVHCCEQKERLNNNSRKIVIELGAFLNPRERETLNVAEDAVVTVKASDFYDACEPLIERTLETLARVTPDGDSLMSDVAGIYVVGGASALPAITRRLRKTYGRRVHRSPYPSAATAIGLAIAMDSEAGYQLTERFSHTFGVFREAHDGAEVAFDTIFDRGTTLKTSESAELTRTYRAVHNVGHFRYIECGWLSARGIPSGDITPFADVYFPFDQRLQSGNNNLSTVPIRRAQRLGHLIQEKYAVDPAGIVELTITDLDSGYACRHRLSR